MAHRAESEHLREVLGSTIRSMREERGLSCRELARRVDISAVHMSNVERGKRGVSIPVLRKIFAEIDPNGSVAATRETAGGVFAMLDGERSLVAHLGMALADFLLSLPAEEARELIDVVRRIRGSAGGEG